MTANIVRTPSSTPSGRPLRSGFVAALAAAALIGTTSSAAAETVVGEIASVSGSATVIELDGDRRAVQRGDLVFDGDQVVSASQSSVGIWLDSALAQLDERSRVRLQATPGTRARVVLIDGAVRVLDPRTAGEPISLAALDASTQISGGDVEARLLFEKTGAYALMGDRENPIRVTRNGRGAGSAPGGGAGGTSARPGEALTASRPGNVIIANNRESLFEAPASANRIGILDGGLSLANAGPSIDGSNLVPDSLPSVASGPPLLAFVGNEPGGGLNGSPGGPLDLLSACGTINGGCSLVGGATTPGITIIEQNPTTSPFPGAGTTAPGF